MRFQVSGAFAEFVLFQPSFDVSCITGVEGSIIADKNVNIVRHLSPVVPQKTNANRTKNVKVAEQVYS